MSDEFTSQQQCMFSIDLLTKIFYFVLWVLFSQALIYFTFCSLYYIKASGTDNYVQNTYLEFESHIMHIKCRMTQYFIQ